MSPDKTSAFMNQQATDLLHRFQPCLRYDSLEGYFADSAEEWVVNPDNRLCRKGGQVIADPGSGLSLAFLGNGDYANDGKVEETDYIESAKDDYTAQYGQLRSANKELRNWMYGRFVETPKARWLQYWFWYFLNDYQLAWGYDVHEGDWEMVQFRLRTDNSAPEIAVYAQHEFCEIRGWEEVERLAKEKQRGSVPVEKGDEDRPLVYVGRGSHASFFEAGFHSTNFYDITNGRRRARQEAQLKVIADPVWDWLEWPGHWGGSRTGFAGPTGPAEHPQWAEPEALVEKSPHIDPPPAQEARLWARRRRSQLLLEFDFSKLQQPPKRLIATVNSIDEQGVPPRPFRFAISGAVLGSLQTDVVLAADKHYDVSLAVVDSEGRPGEAQIFEFGPSGTLRGLLLRLLAAFGRLVHLWRMAFGREYPTAASAQADRGKG